MTRLVTAIRTDVIVQLRNQLYTIGIGVAILVGVVFARLASTNQLHSVIPALLLMFVGGTTFLYVGAMIFFEKEQGTLQANMVSPLRVSEYLWAKILTLSALATLESVIMVGLSMAIMSFSDELILPNVLLLLVGILSIGVIYTLMGIILMVRYDQITDFLIPMAFVVSVLQLPFLHFWGIVEHPVFLLLPTSAPTMIIRGAFLQLVPWEWFYAIGYTTALIVGLTIWAYRAFYAHIIEKVR